MHSSLTTTYHAWSKLYFFTLTLSSNAILPYINIPGLYLVVLLKMHATTSEIQMKPATYAFVSTKCDHSQECTVSYSDQWTNICSSSDVKSSSITTSSSFGFSSSNSETSSGGGTTSTPGSGVVTISESKSDSKSFILHILFFIILVVMWAWLAPVIVVAAAALLGSFIAIAVFLARKKKSNKDPERAVVLAPRFQDVDTRGCEELSPERFPLEVFFFVIFFNYE